METAYAERKEIFILFLCLIFFAKIVKKAFRVAKSNQ
jgi:hypothetical protein